MTPSWEDDGPAATNVVRFREGPYLVTQYQVRDEAGRFIAALIVRWLRTERPTPLSERTYLISIEEIDSRSNL